MLHAYTPGLRISPRATVRRRRQLPLKGEVLVSQGDAVTRDQVVAETDLPGNVTALNLVNTLSCTPAELGEYMLKAEGEPVRQGEPLAETRPFLKWFKTTVESPITGVVESISGVTGQIILRGPPSPVQVLAYVDGRIVEILPEEGVVVETTGAFLQGIFGLGGETWGPLRVLAQDPSEILSPDRLDEACKGAIVVAGSLLRLDLIEAARAIGVAGLIGAGIHDSDLRDLLGYDLGVAITGAEDIGLTLIITEGFGRIDMGGRAFEIFSENAGRGASISGATQIRAGVLRPEILIPSAGADLPDSPESSQSGLTEGALLRVIRAPYFGRVGRVSDLPADLQVVESETRVRVLEVRFEDGERALVPRANVERIEE